MIAALLWMNRPAPAPIVSAAALLQQSVNAEKALAAQNDLVLHRTLDLEESGADGQTIARRKIEVWQSGERGLSARRLYDEHGKLLAGIWTRKDGVQTLYQHGTQPKLQVVPKRRELNAIGVDYLWQVPLSAEEFSGLVGDPAQAQVEERPEAYVVHYTPSTTPTTPTGLMRASLTLSRAGLHASEMTLLVATADDAGVGQVNRQSAIGNGESTDLVRLALSAARPLRSLHKFLSLTQPCSEMKSQL